MSKERYIEIVTTCRRLLAKGYSLRDCADIFEFSSSKRLLIEIGRAANIYGPIE